MVYFVRLIASLLLVTSIASCGVSLDHVETRTCDYSRESREGDTVFAVAKDSVSKVFVIHEMACLFFEKEKNEYALEVIDILTGESIRSFVKYGRDQNEMLLVDVSRNNNRIVLTDIIKNQYVDIDIDAIKKESYHVETGKVYVHTQEMIPYKGERYLCLNPDSFNDMAPRFYVTNRFGRHYILRQNRNDCFNVVDGTLIYNQVKDRIAFLSLYDPFVEIWTTKKDSMIRLLFSREEKVQIIPIKNGKKTEFYFVDHVPICFVGGDSDDQGIVAAYLDEKGQSYILAINWEGVVTDSFAVNGRIRSVSLTDTRSDVYCWLSSQQKDELVKFPIYR